MLYPDNRNTFGPSGYLGKAMKKILCIVLLVLLLPALALADLEAFFLDVGQGDCTVILCDGEAMIIDGGPASASDLVYAFLRDTLEVKELKYVVSTHPHEDHLSGLNAVLNAVPTDLVLSPVTEWNTRRFERFMKYARKQGAPVVVPEAGDRYSLGGAVVTVLQCWPEAVAWRENDVNDMSIMIRVDYGKTSLIVTGDAEEASEYMVLDSGLPLKADVLRVGHHGSTYSTSAPFLKAVSPAYAVISCGEGNIPSAQAGAERPEEGRHHPVPDGPAGNGQDGQ
jgi:competence protein ComEC